MEQAIEKLDQDPALASRDLYKVLVVIRTIFMDQEQRLIQNGIVPKLVQHLKRPNSKIVDVALRYNQMKVLLIIVVTCIFFKKIVVLS